MREKVDILRILLNRHIIGQERLVERLLVGLLSGGHLLLEGMPGLAKTTAVNVLANATHLSFRRVQFTPDMIPGDITGTDIFLPRDGRFEFTPGPLFHEIILADEINRAPPKVQSALLEAMQERQVTVGGSTRPLTDVFMVIATQNPIEHEGTYPLPEAQMDRFLMKVTVDYPSEDEELRILQTEEERSASVADGEPDIDAADIRRVREMVRGVYLDPMLERYIVTLVSATRNPGRWDPELAGVLEWGASPRATLALARSARALAWLRGREFVEPDDIISLAPDVMGHRIGLSFAGRTGQSSPTAILDRLIEHIPIP